jgi:hypothetical protein
MDQNTDRKTFIWVSLIVALIGGICLIIAAIIEISPTIPSWSDFFDGGKNNSSINDNHTAPTNSSPEPAVEKTTETSSVPLLSQTIENIGTGVFTQAASSDGMAEISYNEINAQYSNIQTINPQTSDTGCGIARYDVSELWFAGAAGSSLLINGEKIGQLSSGNGPHGHMISIDIFVGDEICIGPIPSGGYGMVLGPDVYFHYDSYCFRGFCP